MYGVYGKELVVKPQNHIIQLCNLVAHLKANYGDQYAKFTELKTKIDSKREIVRKD